MGSLFCFFLRGFLIDRLIGWLIGLNRWNLPWKPELGERYQGRSVGLRFLDQFDAPLDGLIDVDRDAGPVLVFERHGPVWGRGAH